LLLNTQGEKLGVSIYEEGASRKRQVSYKLEIAKMMSGLLSDSFNIMVLPLGQKMDPELSHPNLYAQSYYLAPCSS
jgi:hypothetical protein